jgi:predicted dehydrogenase
VLCEKPVALTIEELLQLESVANENNSYFYEAFMIRSHPQWHWLQNLDIGEPQSAHFVFSYPQQPSGNYRNRADDGGGPLYDIGCYAILSGCLLFSGMPEVISANAIMNNNFDVEKQVDAVLMWPNGAILNFTVSGSAALCQSLSVLGANGWAKLNVPVNPPEVTHAYWSKGGLQEGTKVSFPACNQYKLMVDDFVSQANSGVPSDFSISRVVTKTINDIQRIAGLTI